MPRTSAGLRSAARCGAGRVTGRMDRTIGGKSADIAADSEQPASYHLRPYRSPEPAGDCFAHLTCLIPDAITRLAASRRPVPQQALYQLNNPFMMNRSVDLAELTKKTASDVDPALRIRQLFTLILRRNPDDQELREMTAFIKQIQAEQSKAGSQSGWSYGYGALDESKAALTQFTVFPFAGEGKWQGSATLPDPTLGWTSLHKQGGHTGGDLGRCAVRRWTADVDCRVAVNGVVRHENEQGDGIRFRIIKPDGGFVADVVAQNSTMPLAVETVEVGAGQSLDFVADCRSNESHDSFNSRLLITQLVGGKIQRTWNSEDDFRDQPGASRLNEWAQLAQTLLLTNEFVFVD
jgi:hypothetical protein